MSLPRPLLGRGGIGSEAVIYTIRPAAPVTLSYHPSVAPLEGKTYSQDEVTSGPGSAPRVVVSNRQRVRARITYAVDDLPCPITECSKCARGESYVVEVECLRRDDLGVLGILHFAIAIGAENTQPGH